MLRTVINPQENLYPLEIPAQYIGKVVEVLLYSTDEVFEIKEVSMKKPSDFFGTLSVSEGEQFQNYVTNSRSEWDRNI